MRDTMFAVTMMIFFMLVTIMTMTVIMFLLVMTMMAVLVMRVILVVVVAVVVVVVDRKYDIVLSETITSYFAFDQIRLFGIFGITIFPQSLFGCFDSLDDQTSRSHGGGMTIQ